jgi:hypothetical protein
MEEADLVMRPSHNILTLDALQVLSRSQVTPELSMSMRIRPICKSLHTYITLYLHPSSRTVGHGFSFFGTLY